MYFVLLPRVNLIVILMTYVCYLYSMNCPTVICLSSMLLLILWRDTTSELWTPVQFPLHCYYRLLLLALFTFTCILLPFTTRYAQSFVYRKPVRLTTSLYVGRKVFGCVVCRFHVAARWRRTDNISGAIVWSVMKLASITFWSLAFSYWFDIPWFHNWGKTCCCAHHIFLLGFPTGCYLQAITYVRYLYSINYPTVICLPSMLLFILWRDTTSKLWTPVDKGIDSSARQLSTPEAR
jgi:hypothetical protein